MKGFSNNYSQSYLVTKQYSYPKKVYKFLRTKTDKMKRLQAFSPTQETPAHSKQRMDSINLTVIPGVKFSQRLKNQRDGALVDKDGNPVVNTNPHNKGPGFDTNQVSQSSSGYMDSTHMEIGTPAPAQQVQPVQCAGGSDTAPVTLVLPGTSGAGTRSNRNSTSGMTLVNTGSGLSGQGLTDSEREKNELLHEKQDDPWLVKCCKAVLKFTLIEEIGEGLNDGDVYIMDPNLEMYLTAFSEGFIAETRALGMSMDIPIPDSVTPGPGQAWWGPLSQIFIKHSHTQEDTEKLNVLFCSPNVSRIVLSLTRVVTELPENDRMLTLAKSQSNIQALLALKMCTLGAAHWYELSDKIAEEAEQFSADWSSCVTAVNDTSARLVSSVLDQAVDTCTLRSIVDKMNNRYRDLHRKFMKLTRDIFISQNDVNFTRRMLVFANILGLKVVEVTSAMAAKTVIESMIKQLDPVIYQCQDEKIFGQLSEFKQVKDAIENVKKFKTSSTPSQLVNIPALQPETNSLLNSITTTHPQPVATGGAQRQGNNDTNGDDELNQKRVTVEAALLDCKEKLAQLEETISNMESLPMNGLLAAKAEIEEHQGMLKDFNINLSITKDYRNKQVTDHLIVETNTSLVNGRLVRNESRTTISAMLFNLGTQLKTLLSRVSAKIDEKKKEQEEARTKIRKLIPDIQIVKCGPGQEHLVLPMYDSFMTRYYNNTKDEFVQIDEPKPIIEDMKLHSTNNLRLLMAGCGTLTELAQTMSSYIMIENKWIMAFISYLQKERAEKEGLRQKRNRYQENQLFINFYSTALEYFRLILKYRFMFEGEITSDNVCSLENTILFDQHLERYNELSFEFKTQSAEAREQDIHDMTSTTLVSDQTLYNTTRSVTGRLLHNRSVVTQQEFGTLTNKIQQLTMSGIKEKPNVPTPWERLMNLIYFLEKKMKEAQSTSANLKRADMSLGGSRYNKQNQYGSGRMITRGANHAEVSEMGMLDEVDTELTDHDDQNIVSMNAASRRQRRIVGNNQARTNVNTTNRPLNRVSYSSSDLLECKAIIKDGKKMLVDQCPLAECQQFHLYGSLFNCPVFGGWTPTERLAAVKRCGACQRCLRLHTGVTGQCAAERNCSNCSSGLHHTMICVQPGTGAGVGNNRSVHPNTVNANYSSATEEPGKIVELERLKSLIESYEKAIKNTPFPKTTLTNITNKDPTRLYTYSYTTETEIQESEGEEIQMNSVQMNHASVPSSDQVDLIQQLNVSPALSCSVSSQPPETQTDVGLNGISMGQSTLKIPDQDLYFNISMNENNINNSTILSSEHPRYNQIVSLSHAINRTVNKSMLNFCWVRVILGPSTDFDYYHKKLSNMPSLTVSLFHGYTVLITRVLLDSGCERSACLQVLRSKLHLPKLREETYKLSTPGDQTVINDTIQVLSIIDPVGRIHKTELYHLPNLSEQFGWTSKMSKIVAADLNMTVSELEYLVHVQYGTTKPYIILGNAHNFANAYPINDLRTIGFKSNFVFNQDLRIFYSPISCCQPFILSGSFGIQKDLNNDGLCSPNITIDSNISDNTIKISAKKILSHLSDITVNESDFIFMNHSSCHACISDQEIASVQMNTGTRVLMTKADCQQVTDFIFSESGMMNPIEYCTLHQKMFDSVVKSCDLCISSSNNLDVHSQSALYKNICDHLKASPNNDGTFTLTQELVFLHHPKDLGHLSRQNLREAMRASAKLEKKLRAMGRLEEVDKLIQDRLNSGEMELVTENDIKDLMSGKKHGNFVRRGITFKEESIQSKIRLLDDTSIPIRGLGTSLSDSQRAPRVGVTCLVGMLLRLYCVLHSSQSDISAAYIQCRISDPDSYLFMSIWYYNVMENGTKYPQLMRALTCIFGMSNANTSLRAGIEVFVLEALKLPESKKSLLRDLYVDNFLHTGDSPEQLAAIMEDVVTAAAKYSYRIRKFFIPHWLAQTEPFQKFLAKYNYTMGDSVISLGTDWSLIHDQIKPFWKLSAFKSVKGVLSGPKLHQAPVTPDLCTRRSSGRTLCQLFDVTGRFGSMVISSAKLLHSKVCKAVKHSELDKKVVNVDKDLATTWAQFWNCIGSNTIQPFPRCVLKHDQEITALIISHDATHEIYASTIHAVVSSSSVTESHILAGKSHICESSTPKNEQRSTCHSVIMAHETILALKDVFLSQKTLPEIIFVGDSFIASFIFRGETSSRCMLARSLRMKCDSYLSTLTSVFPEMKFFFVWSPSKYLVADKLTRFEMNPIKGCNGDFYRHGPQLYTQEQLKHFCYYFVSNGKKTFSQLPAFNKTKPSDTFESVVANNPHTSAEQCASVTGDPDTVCSQTPVEQSSTAPGSHDIDTTAAESQNNSVTCERQMLHLSQQIYLDVDTKTQPRWGDVSHLSKYCSQVEFNNMNFELLDNNKQFSMKNNGTDEYDGKEDDNELREDTEMEDFHDMPTLSQLAALFVMARHSTESTAAVISSSETIQMNTSENSPITDRFHRIDIRGFGDNYSIMHNKSFLLSKENYMKMINSNSNLLNILNQFVNIIRFVVKSKAKVDQKNNKNIVMPSETDIKSITWRSLIVSDQKYFPYKPKNCQVKSENNMNFVLSRRENLVLPVLSPESPLLERLIWTIHLETSNMSPKIATIHHCYKTVSGTITSCALGVYSDNINTTVSKTLKYCGICSKVDLKYFKTMYGNSFKFTRGNMRIMEKISVDPIGPMRVRAHHKSRNNNVIVYGLLAVCTSTGVTDLVVLESTTAQSVVRALKMIEYRLNTCIKEILVDKGTSLSPKLLTESGKSSWTVTQFERDAQNRSLSESRFVVVKRYWKKLFHQYRGEDNCYILNLTIIELQFVFEMLILATNLIPMNDNSVYSPAFCRYPPALLQDLEKDENSGTYESDYLGKYASFFNELMKIRDDNLAHILNGTFKHKYHHQKGVMDVRSPAVNDIVAMPGKPRPVLARIDTLDSDHTVTLYTGKRYFKAPVKELMLIQPHNPDSTSEQSVSTCDTACDTSHGQQQLLTQLDPEQTS